jgi:hypothetical protein
VRPWARKYRIPTAAVHRECAGAPTGILSDQLSNFTADQRSASLVPSGPPTSEQAEAGPIPGDNRLWLDQEENAGPTRSQLSKRHSEQAIDPMESGARLFAFEHGELLAQGYVFQAQLVTGEKPASQVSGRGEYKREHASILTRSQLLDSAHKWNFDDRHLEGDVI